MRADTRIDGGTRGVTSRRAVTRSTRPAAKIATESSSRRSVVWLNHAGRLLRPCPALPTPASGRHHLVNVLVWHVHGSWTTAFVHGPHRYLLPTLPERGPWGGGRPAAWDWPASAVEVSPEELADADVDVVVLQRPEEIDLAERWLGRRPGRDVPAVFLEHNAPRGGPAASSRHPMADRDDLLLVHVTHFNDLMWDAGSTRHDGRRARHRRPGHRYTGELAAAAVCVNEPVRRGRVTGTDLLPRFARRRPARRLRDGHGRARRALGLRGRPHRRRPAAGPHARRDGPPAGLPASAAVDLAGALPARGHAPGHAGGRAGDHGGPRGGAAGRRGLLHGRRPARARAARAGRRAGPGPGAGRGRPRARPEPVRPRPVPHRLGRRPGPGPRDSTTGAARDSPPPPDDAERR